MIDYSINIFLRTHFPLSMTYALGRAFWEEIFKAHSDQLHFTDEVTEFLLQYNWYTMILEVRFKSSV